MMPSRSQSTLAGRDCIHEMAGPNWAMVLRAIPACRTLADSTHSIAKQGPVVSTEWPSISLPMCQTSLLLSDILKLHQMTAGGVM